MRVRTIYLQIPNENKILKFVKVMRIKTFQETNLLKIPKFCF